MQQAVFIGLGSNLGDRFEALQKAITLLKQAGCRLEKCSSVYETAPWGLKDQPGFLNVVLQISFDGEAEELLALAMQIELQLGRVRLAHWGPRIIDIDLLAFGSLAMRSQRLTVPHPMLAQRAFVLVPWNEIAPDFEVVELNACLSDLLKALPDSEVLTIQKTNLKLVLE